MTQRTIQIVIDVLQRAFNQADLAAIDDGFSPEAMIHDPGMDYRGPAQLRLGVQKLLRAFPDFHFSVLDQLADADRVVIRYRGRGTHSAEFLGIAATGKRIDYTGMLMVRVQGSRITEFWANPDQLGIFKQLGACLQYH